MKKYNSFLFYYIIVLLTSLVACSDETKNIIPPQNDDNNEYWTFPEVVQVNINPDITRITYSDEGDSGVKQYWEDDDTFILYNTSGDTVSYKVSAINSDNNALATFELVGSETLSGYIFYAVYKNGRTIDVSFSHRIPEYNFVMSGQTQSSSAPTGNLKGYDLIVSGPILSFDQTLSFQSQGAMLTFELMVPAASGTINNIIFSCSDSDTDIFKTNYINSANNSSSYSLGITGYYNPTDSYTLKAYMLIPPFSITGGTTLDITLITTKNILPYSYKFTNDKDYVAATRYIFDVSSYSSGTETGNYTSAMENLRNSSDWMDNKPTQGDGSSDNPYIISDGWKLGWLKALVYNDNNNTTYNNKDVNYKLTTNISIEDGVEWTPLGDNNAIFSGNFDGDGNSITNMTISESSNGNQALFGSIKNSYIYNLSVSGSITPEGGSTYAGIVGVAESSTVFNCNNYVSINPVSGYQGQCGGIIGSGNGTIIITNCNNYGKIESANPVGGIIALFQNTNGDPYISGCTNHASIAGSENVGGIIGNADSKITISNCTNNGTITASGYGKVAGIVGIGLNSPISSCVNNGEIIGENYAAQIIGQNNASSCTLTDNSENGSVVISN